MVRLRACVLAYAYACLRVYSTLKEVMTTSAYQLAHPLRVQGPDEPYLGDQRVGMLVIGPVSYGCVCKKKTKNFNNVNVVANKTMKNP